MIYDIKRESIIHKDAIVLYKPELDVLLRLEIEVAHFPSRSVSFHFPGTKGPEFSGLRRLMCGFYGLYREE